MIPRHPKAPLRASLRPLVLAAVSALVSFPIETPARGVEPPTATTQTKFRGTLGPPEAPRWEASEHGRFGRRGGRRGEVYRGPRNVLHGDLLAYAAGKDMLGIYYERTSPEATSSFLFGFGVAWDQTLDPLGEIEADSLDVDMAGVGVQWRYYGSRPFGFHTLMGLSVSAGRGKAPYAPIEYDCYGMEVTVLGVGYQHLIEGRIAIEASLSFRQQVFYMKPTTGHNDGTVGGFGFPLSGSIGFAF